MELSIFKLILILLLVFVLFGAGKLSQVMGDVGKGIRALREGLKTVDNPKSEAPRPIDDKNNNA